MSTTVGDKDRIELVVSAGPDLGVRVEVGAGSCLVGRDRDADLRLTDLTVSRRHLEVSRRGEQLEVRVVEGAAPIKLKGSEQVRATAAIGDKLVVGGTAITVVRAKEVVAAEQTATCEVTDVRTLLGHTVAGIRDLAAIFELSERLDEVERPEALLDAVASWMRKYVHASAAADYIDDPDEDGVEQMVERSEPASGRLDVIVPLIGAAPARIALELPSRTGALGADLRRLLAVAGRVIGSSLARLRSMDRVQQQNSELRRIAVGAESFLGESPAAQKVTGLLERLARSEALALLLGETGAGKSFVARLIHEAGPGAAEPFRVINCAAIPDNLVEAELFGHERGAFTGAAGARQGALEAAGSGTVLLDEIGDLPLLSQAKLLRVLEEKQFERLGSNRTLPLRARVLAATNRDLEQMVAEGTFRSDLYYRVTVVTVAVPSLRERREDIRMLAERFLADLGPTAGRRVTGFSPAAIEALERYRWPGNVRELRNVVEHALVLGDGAIIEPTDLPPSITGVPEPQPTDGDTVTLPMDLASLEQLAIDAALRATGGNRTRAAALLGINRVTLYKKLRAADEQ